MFLNGPQRMPHRYGCHRLCKSNDSCGKMFCRRIVGRTHAYKHCLLGTSCNVAQETFSSSCGLTYYL